MYQYSLDQWIFFFFIYCFIGWIWECLYVSVRKKTWVNRGFLHGPVLPIYGFGAIIILFLTFPVQSSIYGTFLVGMIGATILEYFTGMVMETLFHIRYWDYSVQPCNLHGYICLTSSSAWGVFSVILIKVIHRFIESIYLALPEVAVVISVIVFIVLFIWDIAVSTREALDLKALLETHINISQEVKRIQKRLDVVAAVLADDAKKFKERASKSKTEFAEELKRLKLELENIKSKKKYSKDKHYLRASRILRRNPNSNANRYKKYKKTLEDIRNLFSQK